MRSDEDTSSAFPHEAVFHPCIGASDPRSGSYGKPSSGLTKRELFAAMAMQGLLSSIDSGWSSENVRDFLAYAPVAAVKNADAIIAELAK